MENVQFLGCTMYEWRKDKNREKIKDNDMYK